MSDEGSASVVSRYLRGIDADGAAMGDRGGVLKPTAGNLYSVAAELLKHKGARASVMDIRKIIPAVTDQMARDQSDPETNGSSRDE